MSMEIVLRLIFNPRQTLMFSIMIESISFLQGSRVQCKWNATGTAVRYSTPTRRQRQREHEISFAQA